MHPNVRSDFDSNGYVVIPSFFPPSLLQPVLNDLSQLKLSKHFYYSQSVNKWLQPTVNAHNHLVVSILNPSKHTHLGTLSKSVQKIIYSQEVLCALRALFPESPNFVCWQDMLFDFSTGTVPHRDTWYLDTSPPGSLVGAWIALEDISLDSGAFYVVPSSHNISSSDELLEDHSLYVKQIRESLRNSNVPIRPLTVPAGSLILWHSSLIHGSTPNIDPSLSRKSITAHYYPLGMARQRDNLPLHKRLRSLQPTSNPSIFRNDKLLRTPFFYSVPGRILTYIPSQLRLFLPSGWNMRHDQ